ncbi:MAG TPA: response regulator [Clostridia bacterium]|nr:response regulator [Clostridia bacterium]
MVKVMIIDDEEIIREGLKTTVDWEELGCEIAGEAEDGESGYKAALTIKPDLVFTDIRMPGMDGLQMIARLRDMKSTCKVIILTGFRDFEYAQEAIRQGAFRFLLKPVRTDELKLAISEAVKEIKSARSKNEIFSNLEKRVKEYYGIEQTKPENTAEKEKSGDSSGNPKYLVGKALAYIKENYASDLNLKTVADEIYVSTWYLSKLLKKETGDNFINILNRIRVENAKKLLQEPKYKIYEIANVVGFTDVPYFTKTFKKVTGQTPMEYKNSK